jgi:hypothetical protein
MSIMGGLGRPFSHVASLGAYCRSKARIVKLGNQMRHSTTQHSTAEDGVGWGGIVEGGCDVHSVYTYGMYIL